MQKPKKTDWAKVLQEDLEVEADLWLKRSIRSACVRMEAYSRAASLPREHHEYYVRELVTYYGHGSKAQLWGPSKWRG
jgi:hypothetical protein